MRRLWTASTTLGYVPSGPVNVYSAVVEPIMEDGVIQLTYMYIHTMYKDIYMYIYIYVCIKRERDRETQRERDVCMSMDMDIYKDT